MIKIEYRRAIHQNAIPTPCQPQTSNVPPADAMIPCGIPLPREFQRIHPEERQVVAVATEGSSSSLTTRKPSISTFRGATEPSKSSFPAAFLTETDLHSEIAVTHSKQTTATFLTETRIAHFAFRMVSREPRNSAFLTGSGSQTEIDVTRRKQTTKKFLTGARTAISDSAAQPSNSPSQGDKCPSRK